ncbi:GerAB/ArcD/ProY family transporter [Paenibacillus cremeus]|uniref:GerAB/ArcD/ProY family transporter n=1 Tax=Paenibacillus cremeus TaxID=2163881 RepID=A0A559K6Q7_9BACL|nr:endospore germination permease [Paenibacillus cremeus]TVY07810.1 GerAB/ArcD/ProY family transporter [Paenibacillus cremeus]
MIEQGRISPIQLAILIHPTILATALVTMPALTAKYAHQDLWLSPLLAGLPGVLALIVAYQLHKQFPGKTPIQYFQDILGTYLGKMIGLVYLFIYIQICGMTLRQYADFIAGTVLPLTPTLITVSSLVFVCALAVYGGVELIARSAQALIPIATITIVFMIVVMIPDMDFKQIRPILGDGFHPLLLGAWGPAGWFSEVMLFSFIFPFVTESRGVWKWSCISLIAVVLTTMIVNLACYLVLTTVLEGTSYPLLIAIRNVSLSDFFEHVESLLMAIWVIGLFVKLAVIYYIVVLGLAQWLRLDDYRVLILPIGFLLMLFSHWAGTNSQYIAFHAAKYAPFYLLTFQFVLPALLLMVSTIRRAWKI